ncbi:MAG: amidohydrolase family protein [Acidobacteriota bacterium]
MKSKVFLILLAFGPLLMAKETLIRNANIMTVTQGTIKGGSVLIRDGKIAAVGKNLSAGAGAEVIDVKGQWITPGIIDCHSHIATDGINEGSVSVSSMTGIEDTLNPTQFNIYRDLAGGVTTANVLHGSANPIGGKNAVIKLRWGKSAREMKFKGAKPGIKFALGENPKRRGIPLYARNNPRRYPSSRMGVEDVIRSAFREAQAYRSKWEDFERKKAKGIRVMPPRRDFKLEPLVEVLKGERLVHSHCYRADEILMLIRVAEDFGFKIATFQHVLEGYKVAKEIAAHGAGASTFSDWWAYKVEAYDAIPYNAAIMTRKGVVVSLNSDSAEEARHLNQEAAKTIRYGGLSEDEALALVTLNPARQLQIDDRVGSIDAGKDADLVVFNTYPLSVYAVPEKVFIDGELYFSREKDQERMAQLAKEKKKLLAIEKARSKKRGKKGTEDVVDLSGTWEVEITAPDMTYEVRFELSQEGENLSGQVVSNELGSVPIYDASVQGSRFSFKIEVDYGLGPQEISLQGSVSGTTFSGTATPAGEDEGAPMEGRKTPGSGLHIDHAGGAR